VRGSIAAAIRRPFNPRSRRSASKMRFEMIIDPSGANEISNRSNNASRVAINGSPLYGSIRSAFDESRHGLICDARIASSVVTPVTQQ